MIDVPTPDTDQIPDTDTRVNSKTKSSTTFLKTFLSLVQPFSNIYKWLIYFQYIYNIFSSQKHEKKSILELIIKYVGAGSYGNKLSTRSENLFNEFYKSSVVAQ